MNFVKLGLFLSMNYIENQDFKNLNFNETPFEKGEYEGCNFKSCVFSNVDLSKIIFSSCSFENCDLSLANITDTSFNLVNFKGSKLMGIRFDLCKKLLFGANFKECKLNDSSFFLMILKNIKFENCQMQSVDFSQSDLTGASFYETDLTDAIFDDTNLEKADFTSARNFRIDPKKNKLKKAKFSKDNLQGLVIDLGVIVS